MAPRKELSVDQREMIVNISKQGKSIRSIGILLNISKSSVFATLRRMKETGSVANKPGRGKFLTVVYGDVFIFLICDSTYFFRL